MNAKHPGVELKSRLKREKITPYRVAIDCGLQPGHVARVCRQAIGITPELSVQLGRYLGDPLDYWAKRQIEFDVARAAHAKGIAP